MKKEEIKKQLLKEIESLKDKKGFLKAGFPRFLGLFGRDALISAWQLLEYDSSIARNTLLVLVELQGEKIDLETGEQPGKICHEYYPKNTSEYWWKKYKAKCQWLKKGKVLYVSCDSTPLFLILLGKYFEKTRDNKLVKKLWPNVLRALNWMRSYGDEDKDGFLDYQRKNPKNLFNQGWKDTHYNIYNWQPPIELVEIQGYKYLALKSISYLQSLHHLKFPKYDIKIEAKNFKKSFLKKYWWPKERFFYLALDGKDQPYQAVTSNPGHLLFTGIVNRKEAGGIVKRLFKKDIWTEYGIRTHSMKEPNFGPLSYHLGSIWPHDNWIIAQGLKKLGYQKEYSKIKNALFKVYKELGFMPEYYGVVDGKFVQASQACYPQAWASGALFNFLEAD